MNTSSCEREYDFALVIQGVPELSDSVTDALFNAGCDDATFRIQYGRLYGEFSRSAKSLEDAILSAIQNVHDARIGASVLRVDECNLVTPAEIGRRIGRSRQLVYQYINGIRGPGNFPAPECHLGEGSPLWAWCEVSYWLAANNIVRPEEGWNAEVVAAINTLLELMRQEGRNPKLVGQIRDAIGNCP
jgi:hypothetical protein